VCHPLADLGAWSPEYLLELARHPLEIRSDQFLKSAKPDDIRKEISFADADNRKASLSWEDRIGRLVNQWTSISYNHRSLGFLSFVELSARALWGISKALATYVGEDSSVPWWRGYLPRNRIAGITLAEKARDLIKLRGNEPEWGGLAIGMTHTVSVHYRGPGLHRRALYQYRKHARGLLDDDAAVLLVRKPADRAYFLTAYCVDLAELGRKEARNQIERAISWARDSGDLHSVADTVMRAGQMEIPLGNPAGLFKRLDKRTGDGRGWNLIEEDEPIVQVITHKLCGMAFAELEEYNEMESQFRKGLELASQHGLEDQRSKIVRIWSEIECRRDA